MPSGGDLLGTLGSTGRRDRLAQELGALELAVEVEVDAGVEDLPDLHDQRPLHGLLRHVALAEAGDRFQRAAADREPALLAGAALGVEGAAVAHGEVEVRRRRGFPAGPALAEAGEVAQDAER